MKYIWLNGHRFAVPADAQTSLRVLRSPSLPDRLFWLDAVCINTHDFDERRRQLALVARIFAAVQCVSIHLEDASEDEVWALEIMRLTEQLLKRDLDSTFVDLVDLLRSREPTNPFGSLKSLFQRPWWSRPWVLQEAILGKSPVLLYGIHALPWTRLQDFVSFATYAFQPIANASQSHNCDSSILSDTVEWENVLGLVRMRGQLQRGVSTKPRDVIQLLYASRHFEHFDERYRFWSLEALMPPGAPTAAGCRSFCFYTMLLTKSLDVFTLYFCEKPDGFGGDRATPSWFDPCVSSRSMQSPQPLLFHELVTGSDGPFCAGGREFQKAPWIRSMSLHLEGFIIDTILATHEPPSESLLEQTKLSDKGYSAFARRRRWFWTAGGRSVLGPERAEVGTLLTILIGGKTLFLLEKLQMFEHCLPLRGRSRKPLLTYHFRLIGEW